MKRSSVKKHLDAKKVFQDICQLEDHVQAIGTGCQSNYLINLFKARWYVFSGNVESSLPYYQEAFKESLYRAGGYQIDIINEGIVCAAYSENRSFLKQLKEQGVVFGLFEAPYEHQSQASLNPKSRSNSPIIHDWEVNQFKSHFFSIFPEDSFFTGVSLPEINKQVGAGLIDLSSLIVPDYNSPNRKIKPDLERNLSYPQIVWFAMNNDKEVVKKLVEVGARVNVSSHSGDTALLMSIQELNPQNLEASFDETLFNLLISQKHTTESLNLMTAKIRLTPIFCAIDTGRLDVVKKLIEAGVDIDLKAGLDDMSPLYYCINLIYMVKKLKQGIGLINLNENHLHPKKAAEAQRRYSNGLMGFSTAQNYSSLIQKTQHSSYNNFKTAMFEIIEERMIEHYSLNALRDIACILMVKGANLNAQHKMASEIYTPAILAIESDEAQIVTKMLEYGLPTDYEVEYRGKLTSIRQIAQQVSASNVLRVLQ